jgi:uncharacterized membrane protein
VQGQVDGAVGDQRTVTSELKDVVREAALEVLKPVARKATASAAKYAVTKGPDLVKDRVGPALTEAGGAGGLAKGLAGRVGGAAGGLGDLTSKLPGIGKKNKAPSGTGRGRRLPVQESVDVGVDIQTAYDQFTQFEEWPKFMHRVERAEQRDDATVMIHENIWGVRRSWEAEIVEQTPCERIVWRSNGGPQVVGVVTFHALSDNLTRVLVNMDFQPQGLFEKTASGMRLSRRALRSDLMRFKAFVEMRDEATGQWRGRIEEGDVVEAPGDDRDDEEAYEDEQDEPRAEEDEEEEDEEDEESEDEEEPRAESDEDEDEDEEEEDEPEEKPIRRRRAASRTRATTARRRRG